MRWQKVYIRMSKANNPNNNPLKKGHKMAQDQHYKAALKSSKALVISLFMAGVGIVCSSPYLHGVQARIYGYWMISLFAIIGATTGWLLGVIVSPRGDQDKRFTLISSAIGTFFSGFLLGQLSKAIDLLSHASIGQGIVLIRAAFAVGWFVIALSITFLTRSLKDEA